MSEREPAAHMRVGLDDDCPAGGRDLERMLHNRFDIEHTTLQVDYQGGQLLSIEANDQYEDAPSARSRR